MSPKDFVAQGPGDGSRGDDATPAGNGGEAVAFEKIGERLNELVDRLIEIALKDPPDRLAIEYLINQFIGRPVSKPPAVSQAEYEPIDFAELENLSDDELSQRLKRALEED